MKILKQTLPGAWICTNDSGLTYKNHGRKSATHNKIYLKDNEEFEIELYNPLTENVLAVIYLDGKPISKSGIVVRAGQRFYLDCFYDDRKKFIFRTYEVDDTVESGEAIAKNGLFEVQFFKEKILKKYEADKIVHHYHHNYYHYDYWNRPLYWNSGLYTNLSTPTITIGSINSMHQFRLTNNSETLTSSLNALTSDSVNTSNLQGSLGMEFAQNQNLNEGKTLNKVETGQIDKGQMSDQKFVEVNMDFDEAILNKIEYQLLPESRKPAEFTISNNSTLVNKITLDAENIELNGTVKINGQDVEASKRNMTKISQLLELKAMLQEKLINEQEFQDLKKEILN